MTASPLLWNSSSSGEGGDYTDVDSRTPIHMERVLVEHVIGKICLLGIAGNVLNLIVLTQKRLTTNMERLER